LGFRRCPRARGSHLRNLGFRVWGFEDVPGHEGVICGVDNYGGLGEKGRRREEGGGRREEGKRERDAVRRVVFTWVSWPGLYKLHILCPVCVYV
jgi:hypothetical protein